MWNVCVVRVSCIYLLFLLGVCNASFLNPNSITFPLVRWFHCHQEGTIHAICLEICCQTEWIWIRNRPIWTLNIYLLVLFFCIIILYRKLSSELFCIWYFDTSIGSTCSNTHFTFPAAQIYSTVLYCQTDLVYIG